jgi:hypothetical protein
MMRGSDCGDDDGRFVGFLGAVSEVEVWMLRVLVGVCFWLVVLFLMFWLRWLGGLV